MLTFLKKMKSFLKKMKSFLKKALKSLPLSLLADNKTREYW